jgi:tetratricopeptide (TPR) repeat protein
MTMPKLFISYRREDSIAITGRIYDRLVQKFGETSVFMDVDSISPGADFRQVLREAVSKCDVCMVMIGEQWLEARQHGIRRLDDPHDYVRIEIEAALTREIPVVPVLIGQTPIPSADTLPPTLAKLVDHNAIRVDPGQDFHDHVNRLIRGLEHLLSSQSGTAKGTGAVEAEEQRQQEAEKARQRQLQQQPHRQAEEERESRSRQYLSPASFIRATKAAPPACKYAMAVAGLVAIVAVVLRFGVSLATLVFGSIIIGVLMIVFVVFAQAAAIAKTILAVPALVRIWSFLLLALATAVGLSTSAFFNTPLPLKTTIMRAFSKPLEPTRGVVQSNPQMPSSPSVSPMPPQMTAMDFYNKGKAKYDRQDYEAALADFTQAITLNPNDPDAYSYRGLIRDKLYDYEGALADHTQAITLNPQYSNAYVSRGNARAALHDYEGALADYTQAITLDPKHVNAYYNRGTTRGQLHDYEGALPDLTQALTLDPRYVNAYHNRAVAREALHDYEGAVADYTRAIALDPKYAKAYYNRGGARAAQGDWQGALADYQKAADLYQQQGMTSKYQDALNQIKKHQR